MMLRVLMILLLLGSVSCKRSDKAPVEIVKAYYQALNDSDYKTMSALVADSITTREIDYTAIFSKNDYLDYMKWDSVFKPKYKILEIKEDNGLIKTKISKECQRTLFLNEEAVVTSEIVTVMNGKVSKAEIDKYEVFNDSIWDKNRAELVAWIALNHPELEGFLQDQTKKGALNYIKAIDYFESKD